MLNGVIEAKYQLAPGTPANLANDRQGSTFCRRQIIEWPAIVSHGE